MKPNPVYIDSRLRHSPLITTLERMRRGAMVPCQKSYLHKLLRLSALLYFASTPVHAMTCSDFNRLAPPAATVKQVLDAPASEPQVTAFKKVIADHAADVSFNRFSARSRALTQVRKNNQLVIFVRESLALTRWFCFENPRADMRDVAIEQFDYLLDAVAKKL
jgi:hypothetical protein